MCSRGHRGTTTILLYVLTPTPAEGNVILMQLAIELADGKGYGTVHKDGCRDLRDAEPLGNAETYDAWFDRIGWPVIATLINATDPGTFMFPYLFSAILYH